MAALYCFSARADTRCCADVSKAVKNVNMATIAKSLIKILKVYPCTYVFAKRFANLDLPSHIQ
jgi:hypothetical protein